MINQYMGVSCAIYFPGGIAVLDYIVFRISRLHRMYTGPTSYGGVGGGETQPRAPLLVSSAEISGQRLKLL